MISEIIFFLLKKGCHKEAKRITTGEIAEAIGVSQQTASRKLISLEKSGELIRGGGKVFLTEKAVAQMRSCVTEVLNALEGTATTFSGVVVQGLGEGAYYCSRPPYAAGFKKKLGFKPFPGTLNVTIPAEDIEKRIMLRQQKAIEIPGFKKGSRSFGKIAAYRCMISGTQCAIVFPERSLHGLQVLEIISPANLKKKLGLIEGSKIRVEVV